MAAEGVADLTAGAAGFFTGGNASFGAAPAKNRSRAPSVGAGCCAVNTPAPSIAANPNTRRISTLQ
jgi:hypothetical protein